MHAYFAGDFFYPADMIAFEVHDDHVGRFEKILTTACWGSQDAIRAEARGEIP
jgi:hypothetical protein